MSLLAPNAFAGGEALAQLSIVRNPVAGDITQLLVPQRLTLAEIIAQVEGLPEVFHRHGTVTLSQRQADGQDKITVVPRRYWARSHAVGNSAPFTGPNLWVTGRPGRPVHITLHAPAMGGGGKGKSILSIVAALALAAVATAITGGAAAGLIPGLFAAGSASATALAVATTFVGRLAITMASQAAAKPKKRESAGADPGQAGASGNTLEPGGPSYRVAGLMKCFPPMASWPLVDLVGNDEYVEACYLFAGPHQISDLKAEGTAFGEVPDLQYYVDDGTATAPSRLLRRYGKQSQPNFELKAHRRSETTPARLYHQATPELSLPDEHVETTGVDPDEIWVQLLWGAGMTTTSAPVRCLMSVRLRMAISGTSDWINLPELMFSADRVGRISKNIKITWDEPITPLARTAYVNGAYASFHTVPQQTVTPASTGGWNAHASFINSATLNDCARVEHREDGFTIYLDPAVFPRGNRWKIGATRSCLTRQANFAATASAFAAATYTAGGAVYDLFGYFLSGSVAYTANGANFYAADVAESCSILRFASVWNRPPLPLAGDAAIEVIGKNINVAQVSCVAGGLVKCWDGTAFADLAASSNPADHFHHVLTDSTFAKDPVPPALVDVAELSAWRADCLANDWRIAAVFNGSEWRETLNAIAAAGLAKLREGRLFGVVRQRNTSALGIPVSQHFSPRNAAGFRVSKSFASVPDGAMVSFRNRDLDWEQDERLVLRPGVTATEASRIIALNAVGIDDPDQIDSYFRLYLATAWHRDHTFAFTTFFGALKAREGDIVSINHLMVDRVMLSARIGEVTRNGTNQVTAVTLDAVPGSTGSDDLTLEAHLEGLADVVLAGAQMGAAIADGAGLVTTHQVTAADARSRRITFTTPFINDDIASEHVVSLGRLGSEQLRCEITHIENRGDWRFDILCVPEAPEIWT